MKNLCVTYMMLFFAITGHASSTKYECEGDGLQISFAEFFRRSGNTRAFSFSQMGGSEHRVEAPNLERTVLGQIVSMSYKLENADGITHRATLIVPKIFLTSHNSSAHFDTVFVLTEQDSTFSEKASHHIVRCSATLAN